MKTHNLMFVAVFTVGCLDLVDPVDPKVGEPLAARCANEDSDPDNEVSFTRDLLPVFRGETNSVGCSCHNPDDPNPIGVQESGLDLTVYSQLRAGGVNSLRTIVIPGAPCDSVLWQKVSPGPPFGSRMPFNGPPFLDENIRQLISDWIAEGARDN
ncbi:MAG: c-type cytochrome domain-containing protein [Myxococcota bacterium]